MMSNRLFLADVPELDQRLAELDEWSRAVELGAEDLEEIRQRVFPDGLAPDDDWNDYHRVRSEYDRRAAEEFDLGQ